LEERKFVLPHEMENEEVKRKMGNEENNGESDSLIQLTEINT
jgi:hypothetical protein